MTRPEAEAVLEMCVNALLMFHNDEVLQELEADTVFAIGQATGALSKAWRMVKRDTYGEGNGNNAKANPNRN